MAMLTVISCWYNEEFLAPFFLSHYSFADRIIVLLDDNTKDLTEDVLSLYHNVIWERVHFDYQMSERLKVAYLNEEYKKIKEGYVMNVDADEFVFTKEDEFSYTEEDELDREDNLGEHDYDIANVKLYNVFRHKTDKDLDLKEPIGSQRCHGVHIWPYIKPIVVRAGLPGLRWTVGNHTVIVNGQKELYNGITKKSVSDLVYRENFEGAHWVYADPCFAVDRRMDRLRRMGSIHPGDETREGILRKMKEHENDNVVF